MKSFTNGIILALIAAAAASPTSRRQSLRARDGSCKLNSVDNPNNDDVRASIQQWAEDVNTVNAFLDSIGQVTDPATIVSDTQAVQAFAQDEPCQLTTLTNFGAAQGPTDAFSCATADLANVFGTDVLGNLQSIIDSNGDADVTANALISINTIRCCSVLPDVDILWVDAADLTDSVGQVPTTANREQACANITCSTNCKARDNGVLG